jgi:hypothetical protein
MTFYRPEFEEFLYALIGADRNEMPLSVLSALARVDVDPWEEAAELTELPKDAAARRLASLFARLPGGHLAQAAPRASVDRLIELLPRRGSSKVPLPVKARLRQMTGSTVAKMLICAALGATALIIAASREPSSTGDHADQPGYSTGSLSPASVPSSR